MLESCYLCCCVNIEILWYIWKLCYIRRIDFSTIFASCAFTGEYTPRDIEQEVIIHGGHLRKGCLKFRTNVAATRSAGAMLIARLCASSRGFRETDARCMIDRPRTQPRN